jgi:hypothetical protein
MATIHGGDGTLHGRNGNFHHGKSRHLAIHRRVCRLLNPTDRGTNKHFKRRASAPAARASSGRIKIRRTGTGSERRSKGHCGTCEAHRRGNPSASGVAAENSPDGRGLLLGQPILESLIAPGPQNGFAGLAISSKILLAESTASLLKEPDAEGWTGHRHNRHRI